MESSASSAINVRKPWSTDCFALRQPLACFKCNATYKKLAKCGKCLVATYCSSECQKSHWNENHKHRCTLNLNDILKKIRESKAQNLGRSIEGLLGDLHKSQEGCFPVNEFIDALRASHINVIPKEKVSDLAKENLSNSWMLNSLCGATCAMVQINECQVLAAESPIIDQTSVWRMFRQQQEEYGRLLLGTGSQNALCYLAPLCLHHITQTTTGDILAILFMLHSLVLKLEKIDMKGCVFADLSSIHALNDINEYCSYITVAYLKGVLLANNERESAVYCIAFVEDTETVKNRDQQFNQYSDANTPPDANAPLGVDKILHAWKLTTMFPPEVSHRICLVHHRGEAAIVQSYDGYYTIEDWVCWTTPLAVNSQAPTPSNPGWRRPVQPHPRFRGILGREALLDLAKTIDTISQSSPCPVDLYAHITGIIHDPQNMPKRLNVRVVRLDLDRIPFSTV